MKRKLTAAILLAIMVVTMMVPTLALAHRRGRGYNHRDWLYGAGLVTLGYLAHKNTNRPHVQVVQMTQPAHVVQQGVQLATPVLAFNYEAYKQNFINSLDDDESALYLTLRELEPNDTDECYKFPYKKDVTKRRLKKIMNALYQEYKYEGVRDNLVYFTKLK